MRVQPMHTVCEGRFNIKQTVTTDNIVGAHLALKQVATIGFLVYISHSKCVAMSCEAARSVATIRYKRHD